MDKKSPPKIVMPADLKVGVFANAFRMVHDSGTEWFLDYLVHSEMEGHATVVARIRVQEAFLSSIRDRLSTTLEEVVTARKKQFDRNIPDSKFQGMH